MQTSHNVRTYTTQIADRYSLALRSRGPLIEIHNAWLYTLMRSLECEPVDDRCPPRTTSCFTCTHFKTCRGNRLHPQCCWVVDFDVSVAVAKRSKHFNVTWALKLSFERDGLATMVVLGRVGNVDLSSLKHNRYWRKFKKSGFKYGFSRENCCLKPNAVYSTELYTYVCLWTENWLRMFTASWVEGGLQLFRSTLSKMTWIKEMSSIILLIFLVPSWRSEPGYSLYR